MHGVETTRRVRSGHSQSRMQAKGRPLIGEKVIKAYAIALFSTCAMAFAVLPTSTDVRTGGLVAERIGVMLPSWRQCIRLSRLRGQFARAGPGVGMRWCWKGRVQSNGTFGN